MRGMVFVALFFAASFGPRLYAAPQDQTSRSNIEQQLKLQYQPTRVGANCVVLQAGSVLVIQQDNIKANPASNQIYWSNLYKKDGRVKQPIIMVKNGASAVDKSTLRFLQVGEKVYVTNIEIKPSDIVFSLQSCGTGGASATDPNDVPYRAELSFQFQKGFIDTVNFKTIQETIGQVLVNAPPTEDPPTTATASGDPQLQTIPPPPPADLPPPTPKTISKGDTKDEVVAAVGQPEKIVKFDAKEIYYYKDFKVTFVSGKVSDIQ